MSLTTEQFRRSFFHAGSGTDLQPLLRFSALTDTSIRCSSMIRDRMPTCCWTGASSPCLPPPTLLPTRYWLSWLSGLDGRLYNRIRKLETDHQR